MTRHHPVGLLVRRVALAAVLLAAATGIAGCAASSRAVSRSPAPPGPVAAPLASGTTESGVSWATLRTGGPSVGGRFWQLLTQDRATGKWRLVTPPGVADNAGLTVTRASDGTMTAGFVPGQLLKFSPLATSTDDGAHWAQGLLPAGLVPDPDSLAALPDGRLVAVTPASVEESGAGVENWTTLITLRALAATTDGRRCGLTGLTGTTGRPDGSALVFGTCSRPGRLGLFSNAGGSWREIDPGFLPGSRAGGLMKVLGLISSTAGTSALFDVVVGRKQLLIPAVLSAGATTWTMYPASWSLYQSMTVQGGPLSSVSGSSSGVWVVNMAGQRGLATGYADRKLVGPHGATAFSLPGPDATIVPSASGGFTALVPGVSTVTVWQRAASGGWQRTQTIDVALAPAGQSS
jgi:hypothetical protein